MASRDSMRDILPNATGTQDFPSNPAKKHIAPIRITRLPLQNRQDPTEAWEYPITGQGAHNRIGKADPTKRL